MSKVWTVGAGAVGGVVASRLARAGHDIAVVDTNDEHVNLIRSPGLVVDGIDAGVITPMRASTLDEAEGAPDVVLLAVRSQSTEAAIRTLEGRLRPDTDVVSLQNGLNEDRIADAIGVERTIGCVVGFGATWIAPGRIKLDAEGELVIGRLGGGLNDRDDRLERVRELLADAFETRITPNVRGALWAKMLVNSMTVLGAVGGMLTGDVLGTPERRRIVADVIAEGARVAHSEGVKLPRVLGIVDATLVDDETWPEVMEEALVRVRRAVGPIKSVTWRDFELGRETEIDAVTGEIVRRGEHSGVPTPLNSAVYAILRDIERGRKTPEPANLDALDPVATPVLGE